MKPKKKAPKQLALYWTLESAKEWLREHWEDGADCPCCGRFVKLYKRKLNSNQAAALCVMYSWHRRNGWDAEFDTRHLLRAGHRLDADFAKLRFWGLIERTERSRRYRITDKGRAFVEGNLSVTRHVYLYDDKPVGRANPDPARTTIRDALGDHFDYDELMRATPERGGNDGSTSNPAAAN